MQLGEDIRDVAFYRMLTDDEMLGNGQIAGTGGDKPEKLDLAWGEGLARVRHRDGFGFAQGIEYLQQAFRKIDVRFPLDGKM